MFVHFYISLHDYSCIVGFTDRFQRTAAPSAAARGDTLSRGEKQHGRPTPHFTIGKIQCNVGRPPQHAVHVSPSSPHQASLLLTAATVAFMNVARANILWMIFTLWHWTKWIDMSA